MISKTKPETLVSVRYLDVGQLRGYLFKLAALLTYAARHPDPAELLAARHLILADAQRFLRGEQ
jgi:hypothetical protein